MAHADRRDYHTAFDQFVFLHNAQFSIASPQQTNIPKTINTQYAKYIDEIRKQHASYVGDIDFILFLMLYVLYNMWYLKRFENDPDFQLFNEAFKMDVSENDFNRYYDAFKQLK